MTSYQRISFLVFGLLLSTSFTVAAQSFTVGSDLMSRYVWRGYDFGESLSIQPTLAVSAGAFELGTWASYSISADGSGANEHDIYISYGIDLGESGSIGLALTDYYFPSPDGLGFFEFDGDGDGAHWIEPAISYSGPESMPISLMAAMFIHNDPDNSLYLEASYPVTVEDVELGFTLGAVAGESGFYGTDGFSLVNVGITASRTIPVTDRFELPVSVSYVLNPDTERTFLVFGVSF